MANLYNGLETMVETVLPIGNVELNYEMDIIAMVSDKFGYAAKTNLKVQVRFDLSLNVFVSQLIFVVSVNSSNELPGGWKCFS